MADLDNRKVIDGICNAGDTKYAIVVCIYKTHRDSCTESDKDLAQSAYFLKGIYGDNGRRTGVEFVDVKAGPSMRTPSISPVLDERFLFTKGTFIDSIPPLEEVEAAWDVARQHMPKKHKDRYDHFTFQICLMERKQKFMHTAFPEEIERERLEDAKRYINNLDPNIVETLRNHPELLN